ncbi:hypothetical protein [Lutibacter sp. HS1-25]|uniref:hypothetical protein n=1 Tax=Lutibacter sp. HS1-25 TaxID=2485000 RepID=UPI0013E95E0C|nr:hypothetical protein [Lutibacter sp. HS1-25]
MEAETLIKKAQENMPLKLLKNNRITDKLAINTLIPKFEFKSKSGKNENPKSGIPV